MKICWNGDLAAFLDPLAPRDAGRGTRALPVRRKQQRGADRVGDTRHLACHEPPLPKVPLLCNVPVECTAARVLASGEARSALARRRYDLRHAGLDASERGGGVGGRQCEGPHGFYVKAS